MNTKTIREELSRQDAQLASAMNSLEQLGNVGIAVPDEVLRALDAACEIRIPAPKTTQFNPPGIRG